MKKLTVLLALLAALTLALALTGCGGETTPTEPEAVVFMEPEMEADAFSETAGGMLMDILRDGAEGTPLDNAQRMTIQAGLPFQCVAVEIQPGLLTGFGNNEITGFTQGAMFGPTMSPVPFIGYIFALEEGADADAFCLTLMEASDLSWNVCITAEQKVASVSEDGSTVYFLMTDKELG